MYLGKLFKFEPQSSNDVACNEIFGDTVTFNLSKVLKLEVHDPKILLIADNSVDWGSKKDWIKK